MYFLESKLAENMTQILMTSLRLQKSTRKRSTHLTKRPGIQSSLSLPGYETG